MSRQMSDGPAVSSTVSKATQCLDQTSGSLGKPGNAETAASASEKQNDPMVHYCVVRSDLTFGQQAAQLIHAVGESHNGTVHPPGTVAVALSARNQEHLLELESCLKKAGLPHVLISECDGEPMAIGLHPTRDRAAIRKVLSSIPLVK